MNTTNMPGFTAEDSLYISRAQYNAIPRRYHQKPFKTGNQKIIPQRAPLCEVEPECLGWCQAAGYRDCWRICCH
jgi:hypothetical protein